jgi:hypothetical protein
MDDITQLDPLFKEVRNPILNGVKRDYPNSESPSFSNLLMYKDKPNRDINIIGFLREGYYFFLTQRYIAKFKSEAIFYGFTLFDLWNEEEM